MIYFIVNPISRAGMGEKIWDKIKSILDKKYSTKKYSVYMSEKAGDIKNIFETLKSKTDIEKIIIVGGDGTINEVINFMGNIQCPIGCISAGTSNDFMRSQGLPKNIAKAVDVALSDNTPVAIDCCVATGCNVSNLFVNGFGVGYDADIIYHVQKSFLKVLLNKFRISKVMYIIFGLRQAVATKRFSVTITADGKTTHLTDCYMVTAMVEPFEGGGILFAPKADYTDGLTDLVILHSHNRLKFVYHLFRALFNLPSKGEGYTSIQFKNASVRFSSPQNAQIDGEYVGKLSEINYSSRGQCFRLMK